MDNVSFLVEATTVSLYGRCFFLSDLVHVLFLFFFQSFFGVFFSDNLSPYQGILFLLSDFSRHAFLAPLIPLIIFPRQSLTIKRELVPLELFSQTSSFILKTSC